MRKKLGEILIDRGVCSPDFLDQAIERQSQRSTRLGEVLAQMGTARWDIEAALFDQRLMDENRYISGGIHWWDRVNMHP